VIPQRYNAAENERNLEVHGEGWGAVGYKSALEARQRYTTMLGVVREPDEPVSVLDVGCGLAHLLDFVESIEPRPDIRYTGIDISEEFIDRATRRRPDADLRLVDILAVDAELGSFDYVILNHLFNWRGELAFDVWMKYWEQMLAAAWARCTRGIAFNAMSKIVDWERDDLFHLPLDTMAAFVSRELSRSFVVHHDYPAYEYTVYVYREPAR
jgi:SAM-dependent methyltransferase